MLALIQIRHHALDMLEPQPSIARHRYRPRVAPAVAVLDAVTAHHHAVAGRVGDAGQGHRALRVPVLVETDGRFNFAAIVNRRAIDMPVNRIKRAARLFSPVN